MKTTIHYQARGQNTHATGTSETHFNGTVRHAGFVADESAIRLADKHAARRGLALKSVGPVFHS